MTFVECKADEVLLTCISIPRKEIIHENKGKFEVCKRLQEQTNCRGLIDEDPGKIQPPYIKKLNLTRDLPQHNLKLFYESRTNNRLVVLCPELEGWIIETSRKAGIRLAQYGLPNNSRELHGIINLRLDNFQRLLAALDNARALDVLKELMLKDR